MERLERSDAKEVFRYFREICGIPHGSGNIEKISDYLVRFAQKRGLWHTQDSAGNVIMIKEAAPGCENMEPLILQGHMDMVAVKKSGCEKDLTRDGLTLRTSGDWLYAEGTSLGGDDGIAVAMMLALLDSKTASHPRLEAVFTVDEETGMDGARAISLEPCRAGQMLNLDSDIEGVFLTSCAGGARLHGCLPVQRQQMDGIFYTIYVEGLQGGHSGSEIHKERGNSNCLAGRLLYACRKAADVRLAFIEGGLADNAIPRETEIVLAVSSDAAPDFEAALAAFTAKVKNELAVKDPGAEIRISKKEEGSRPVLTAESTDRAAFILLTVPNGVQAMSADIDGLVQTSLNLGILKLEEKKLHLDYSVRSSVNSEKELLLDKMKALLEIAGGGWEVGGEYPAWEYKKDSGLRDKMVRVYQQLYGKTPKIEAIHAGLECGILSSKLKGLDCVSIGPDMTDIHTTEERLSIPSVERVWKFLLALLKTAG